jgi:hypothetical protein
MNMGVYFKPEFVTEAPPPGGAQGGFMNGENGPVYGTITKHEARTLGSSDCWSVFVKINGVETDLNNWIPDPQNPKHQKQKTKDFMNGQFVNTFLCMVTADGKPCWTAQALAKWFTGYVSKKGGKNVEFPYETLMDATLKKYKGAKLSLYGFAGDQTLLDGHSHRLDEGVLLLNSSNELLRQGKEKDAEGRALAPQRGRPNIKAGSAAAFAQAGGQGGAAPSKGSAPHVELDEEDELPDLDGEGGDGDGGDLDDIPDDFLD